MFLTPKLVLCEKDMANVETDNSLRLNEASDDDDTNPLDWHTAKAQSGSTRFRILHNPACRCSHRQPGPIIHRVFYRRYPMLIIPLFRHFIVLKSSLMAAVQLRRVARPVKRFAILAQR